MIGSLRIGLTNKPRSPMFTWRCRAVAALWARRPLYLAFRGSVKLANSFTQLHSPDHEANQTVGFVGPLERLSMRCIFLRSVVWRTLEQSGMLPISVSKHSLTVSTFGKSARWRKRLPLPRASRLVLHSLSAHRSWISARENGEGSPSSNWPGAQDGNLT